MAGQSRHLFCYDVIGCNLWVLPELLLYFLLLIVTILLGSQYLPPSPAPLSCEDEAIDKDRRSDTVSLAEVAVTSVMLPIMVIFFVEYFTSRAPRISSASGSSTRARLKQGLAGAVPLVWSLLVGGLISYSIVKIMKYVTARPRPHAWDTCGRKIKAEFCDHREESNLEVDFSNCEANNSSFRDLGDSSFRDLADSVMSYPSGHSCLVTFAAVYMTAYFHYRLRGPIGSVGCVSAFRRWLAVPFVLWAAFVSCSRIWDNRHFWWDVLGGAVLGALVGLYTIVVLCRNFTRTPVNSNPEVEADLEMN